VSAASLAGVGPSGNDAAAMIGPMHVGWKSYNLWHIPVYNLQAYHFGKLASTRMP
jgi:hypothetical protein